MGTEIIKVTIGEVRTASGDARLETILGSCIGIGLLWRQRGLYGLAHCLLARAPDERFDIGGRYVDQAIHSLIQLMSITDTRGVRAVVAGGGNMTRRDAVDGERLVGSLNARAAERELDARGIVVTKQDTGGTSGRKLTIDCRSGEFDIHVIPRLEAPPERSRRRGARAA